MSRKWLLATGRPASNLKQIKNLEICSLHFPLDQYDQKILDKYKDKKVPRGVAVLLKSGMPLINLKSQNIEGFEKGEACAARASRANARTAKKR